MAWSTPKTNFNAADALGASDVNAINFNIVELKDPPSNNYEMDEVSELTTTSTSFADVDATNWSLSITTNGGDVMVHFHGSVKSSTTTNNRINFEIDVDGVAEGGDDGIIAVKPGTTSDADSPVSFTRLITGLSAGSHTFKLQWKVQTSFTATLHAGAGSGGADLHPQFWVREVS